MRFISFILLLFISLKADYKEALNYYNQGNYTKALNILKASKSEYSNPKLHLLWGKIALKLNKTTEAMGAYERVLIFEEDNIEAKKELDKIYILTKRKALVKSHKKLNKLLFKSDIIFGYDNNINLLPVESELIKYYDGFYDTSNLESKDGSKFMRFIGLIDYTNELEDNFFTKTSFNIYHQNNFDLKLYDLDIFTLEAGLGYSLSSYRLYFPFRYDVLYYFDEALLYLYKFNPQLAFAINNKSMVTFSPFYQKRDYFKSKYKSKEASTFGIDIDLIYQKDKTLFEFLVGYTKREADNKSNEKFIDVSFLTLNTKISHKIESFTIKADYFFRYGNYSDNIGTLDIKSSEKREDDFHQFNFGIDYSYSKHLTLFSEFNYVKNNSNYMPTIYNKNIFLAGLKIKY